MTATIGTLNSGTNLTTGGYGEPQDPTGANFVASGGQSSAINVTAATVIKASPGRVGKVIVLGVVGTGGALTINDCTTTGAATAANEVYTSVGTIAVGTVVDLNFPCVNGITVSAVPTGGTPQFAISFN